MIKNLKNTRDYKKILTLLGSAALTLFLLLCIFKGISPLLIAAYITWAILFVIAFYRDDYFLLAFLASFFIFLIGGELLISLGVLKKNYNFKTEINNKAYICIIASLVAIGVSYYISEYLFNKRRKKLDSKLKKNLEFEGTLKERKFLFTREYILNLRLIAIVVFSISLFFSSILLGEKIYKVFTEGFLASYRGSKSSFPGFFSIIAGTLDISFALFLATMPKKKTFYILASIYFFYSSLTLLTFQRMYFFVNYMLIFVYVISRDKFNGRVLYKSDLILEEEKWTTFKSIAALILSFLIIIPLMNKINTIRFHKEYEKETVVDENIVIEEPEKLDVFVIPENSIMSDENIKEDNSLEIAEGEDGWREISEGKNQLIYKGKYLTGPVKLGADVYYFDDKGIQQFDWQEIKGGFYYFSKSSKGKMLTGLQNIEGITYLFSENGYKLFGLQKIGDKEYYFSLDEGKMTTGIIKINGDEYLFGKNGYKEYGWQEVNDKLCYFSPEENGKMTESKEIDKTDKEESGEFTSFAGSQGFSINVIKWGIINRDDLTDRKYMLGNVTDYFLYGSFASKFLKNDHDWYMNGNSIDMATRSHKYAHAISYKVFPDYYLTGRGVGSSFIAEANQDYEILGVILISLVVGFIFNVLYSRLNLISLFLGYLFFREFMFMPRSSFDIFILDLLSIKNLLFIFVSFILAFMIKDLQIKTLFKKKK